MKTAIILSGCGVRDGSEIHESVCALISLEEAGHSVDFYAPDKIQAVVVNGLTGHQKSETRNVLEESARIARGDIRPLSELDVSRYDALVLPGGMGAAMNLCNFAHEGAECTIDPELETILDNAHKSGRAIGLMCIAPVIAAAMFKGVRITLGDAGSTADTCESMGAHHVVCREDEACIDETFRVVTVPAYMKATSVCGCLKSARALVRGLESLCGRDNN